MEKLEIKHYKVWNNKYIEKSIHDKFISEEKLMEEIHYRVNLSTKQFFLIQNGIQRYLCYYDSILLLQHERDKILCEQTGRAISQWNNSKKAPEGLLQTTVLRREAQEPTRLQKHKKQEEIKHTNDAQANSRSIFKKY